MPSFTPSRVLDIALLQALDAARRTVQLAPACVAAWLLLSRVYVEASAQDLVSAVDGFSCRRASLESSLM